MTTRRIRRLGLGAAAVVAVTTAIAVPATGGHAATKTPGLRLLTGAKVVEADRFGTDWNLFLPESVYVAATNGAFEIDASRVNGGLQLEQVARNGSSVKRIRTITTPTGTTASFDNGLPQFFSVVVTDSTGKVVASAHPDFCPVGDYDSQRVSPNSPDNPTYPQSCGDNLTHRMVWGVDQGWADPPYFQLMASPDAMPDGTYTMTVAITPSYATELRIPEAARSTSVKLDVTTDSGCVTICPAERRARAESARPAQPQRMEQSPSGQYTPPADGSGGLPDLAALPAHGLAVRHDKHNGKDYLGFAATIWNAGPGTFDVEGFRRNEKPTMDARQYIYRDGHSVKSEKIGSFEFDNRKGHHHWHLEDVARYDLLDANQTRVVLSDKQSFCLAPTDPIDLTVPGANWNPDTVGLESSCPTDQSLWLRETLPVGWGDTYVQEKGGQSFDITDLPNGRYIIRIATNPFGRIHEVTRNNDTGLLAIDLGGTPGARTVTRIGPVAPKG